MQTQAVHDMRPGQAQMDGRGGGQVAPANQAVKGCTACTPLHMFKACTAWLRLLTLHHDGAVQVRVPEVHHNGCTRGKGGGGAWVGVAEGQSWPGGMCHSMRSPYTKPDMRRRWLPSCTTKAMLWYRWHSMPAQLPWLPTCGAWAHEGEHRSQAAAGADQDAGFAHQLDLQQAGQQGSTQG